MICKVCGSQIKDDDKFCSNCGAKVENPDTVRVEKQNFDFKEEKEFNIPEFTREEPAKTENSDEEVPKFISKNNFSWNLDDFKREEKEPVQSVRRKFDWSNTSSKEIKEEKNEARRIHEEIEVVEEKVAEQKKAPKRFERPKYESGDLFVVPERKEKHKEEEPKQFFKKDQSVYEVEIQEMPEGRGISADEFLKALKEEPKTDETKNVQPNTEEKKKPAVMAEIKTETELKSEVEDSPKAQLEDVDDGISEEQENRLENEYKKIHREINPGGLSVTQEIKFEEMIKDDQQVAEKIEADSKEPLKSKEKVIDEIIEKAEKNKKENESEFNGFVPQFEKDRLEETEESQKDMFGFEEAQGELPEATRRIDKFYTFNAKNQEFQKLLDDEYDRIKGEEDLDEVKSKIEDGNRKDIEEAAKKIKVEVPKAKEAQPPKSVEQQEVKPEPQVSDNPKDSIEATEGPDLSKTAWINILQDDYDENDLTKEEKKKLKAEEKEEKRREKEAKKQKKLEEKEAKKKEKLEKKQKTENETDKSKVEDEEKQTNIENEVKQADTENATTQAPVKNEVEQAAVEVKAEQTPAENKPGKNTQEINETTAKEIKDNTRMSKPLEVRKDLNKLAQGEEIVAREEDEKIEEPVKTHKGIKIAIIVLSIIAALLISLLAVRLLAPNSSISQYMNKVLGIQNESEEDFSVSNAAKKAEKYGKNLDKVSYDKSLAFNKDTNYGNAKIKSSYPFHDSVFYVNDGKEVMYGQRIINTTVEFYSELVNCKGKSTKGLEKHVAEKSDIASNPGAVLGENGDLKETALKIGDVRTSEKGFFVITSLSYKNSSNESKEKMQVVYITAGDKKLYVSQVSQV